MDKNISEMYEDELIEYLLCQLSEIKGKIERGELVEVSTIRQRLHGLAYESQECGHPQIVELDEIDDLLDELSERRLKMAIKITEEQEQRVVELFKSGKTQEQIANTELIAVSTISRIIKKI